MVLPGVTDHGALTGLTDDDHTQYIKHSLATAINDFLVASGAGTFVKKTLAEVKTILGLGTAAYTASADYAVAAKGVTNGDSHDHNGGDGANIPTDGIANDAVDNTKLANMANATLKGRNTAGTGDPEDVTVAQLLALLNIIQSAYVPAITGVTNVAAATAQALWYTRIGNVAHVFGGCQIDPTTTGSTVFRISLPIASNLTVARHCYGRCSRTGAGDEIGWIEADVTNDEALVTYTAAVITNHNITFEFNFVIN
jgi:hypothetical protein